MPAAGVFGVTEYGSHMSSAARVFFFIPKSSSSIRNLDQAVALAAGIITVGFSIHTGFKTRRTRKLE
jgi:hypothetical protein